MALQALVVILLVLAFLLVVGVPISFSIGIAAISGILLTVPLEIGRAHV